MALPLVWAQMTEDEWEHLALSLIAPTLVCAVFAGGFANQSPGVLLNIACYFAGA